MMEEILHEAIKGMVKSKIIQTSNDLKLKKIEVTDENVRGMVYMGIGEYEMFELLKTINLTLNGADETAMGNINEFLDILAKMFLEIENERR